MQPKLIHDLYTQKACSHNGLQSTNMFWLLFKMFRSKKTASPKSTKPSGTGFIVLNILRVCNIIALATVIAGSWIMLVKTVQNSNVSVSSFYAKGSIFFYCMEQTANIDRAVLLFRRLLSPYNVNHFRLPHNLGTLPFQELLCHKLATPGSLLFLPLPRKFNVHHRHERSRQSEQDRY